MKGETGKGGERDVEKGCPEQIQVNEQVICYNYISYMYEQIIGSMLYHADLKPQHILFLTKAVFDLALETT